MKDNFQIINLNKYVLPDIKKGYAKKEILFGDKNSFYDTVEEAFDGSPTNSAILKAYINYVLATGLVCKNGIDLHLYMKKSCIRALVYDFVLFGQCAVEIIWTKPIVSLGEPAQIKQIKHISIKKIGISVDEDDVKNGYWACKDWSNRSKYKPIFVPMFTGRYSENDSEILKIDSRAGENYFSKPSYVSGLQFAKSEEEISNYLLSHIMNGFSAGKIINLKGPKPKDKEIEQMFEDFKRKLSGSKNANTFFLSFANDEYEGGELSISNIEPTNFDAQLLQSSDYAKNQILSSHSLTSPLLVGIREGGGLGSNTDELTASLKLLYRSVINPMREIIIDELSQVFKVINPNIELIFKDFDELNTDEVTQNNPIENEN